MLTQLSATNFKSWPTLGPMRLAPITGLFGTNSSGKSSVLQLLLMLKQTVESSDRATALEFGDERGLTNLGSFRDVVFGHDRSAALSFDVRWTREKRLVIADPTSRADTLFDSESMAFRAKVSDSGSDTSSEKLQVNEFAYSLGEITFAMRRKSETSSKYELESDTDRFRLIRSLGRAWALPAPIKFYGFPDQVYAYYQNAGFLADLQLAFEDLLRNVYYLGPLRHFPKRHYTWRGTEPADMGHLGEYVVDAILASRERGPTISPGFRKKKQTLEQRVAQWLKDLGLIHDFKVEEINKESNLYRVVVQRSPDAAKVVLPDVGFGVSQVLPVIALCYYVPQGSTILLEQPEIHLHPKVQEGLADVLIDAVKTRKVQILVESHSEHLLRRLQRRIAEEQFEPDQAALYFCDTRDGASELVSLDIDMFGDIRNWPKDFFGNEMEDMAAMHTAKLRRRARMAK